MSFKLDVSEHFCGSCLILNGKGNREIISSKMKNYLNSNPINMTMINVRPQKRPLLQVSSLNDWAVLSG